MTLNVSRVRRGLLAIGVSGLALAVSTPTFAQEATAEEDTSGDIIVTANRVEQNLQDVPIAVSAVSGD
ncbi:MAG: hypothetical protein K2X31_02515, partial [Sphingopyxis sp.]|nr:hypothetical protein [Sphingopyxis sp.]